MAILEHMNPVPKVSLFNLQSTLSAYFQILGPKRNTFVSNILLEKSPINQSVCETKLTNMGPRNDGSRCC